MDKLFLFKIMNSNDRDCVKYVELANVENEKINLCGSCFCGCIKCDYAPYEEIKTILTKEEYHTIKNQENIDYDVLLKKLLSKKNQELFEEVIKEEKDYIRREYCLSEEEVDDIFKYYEENIDDYQDRSIICCMWDDEEELAKNYVYGTGAFERIDKFLESYIDWQRMGEDMVAEIYYMYLDNGNIVEYSW